MRHKYYLKLSFFDLAFIFVAVQTDAAREQFYLFASAPQITMCIVF